MDQNAYGKKVWLIADGFWHTVSNGIFPSHEAICVLNTSAQKASITITLFFEDKDEISGFETTCPARKTDHIRMDKLINKQGITVPKDCAYAMLVESNINIVVQYSRLDTSQSEMALMTTIAYPIN